MSLPSGRVIRSLEQIIEWRGAPAAIRLDNGPEYIAQSLIDWATKQRITLMYIQPGKPTQNAYIERYNRTVRHEWLDMHVFESVDHAQQLATEWLWLYNNERPNTAIGGVPPRRLQITAVGNGGITQAASRLPRGDSSVKVPSLLNRGQHVWKTIKEPNH